MNSTPRLTARQSLRRSLVAALASLVLVGLAAPAHAAAPEHDSLILKDVHETVPAPAGCPGPTADVDIVYNLQFHAIFTDETFHFTQTLTGTWSNSLGAGGQFVSRTSQQAPAFPVYAETTLLNVSGVTTTGERIKIKLRFHVTINANDEVTSFFESASC